MATGSSDGPIKISKRIEKELHQTKVVIRRLPPDLTEEKLLEVLSDLPSYNYFYFVAGDPSLGNLATSRAYFSFVDESSILTFRDKYDGLYLESEKGLRYRAVVEFAPYQGIPKRQRKKPDARIATIEQDADYLAFVEVAEVKTQPPSMAELTSYVDSIGASKVPNVQRTPLIDFLIESHKRSSRSGKRSKFSSADVKKKHGKESTKPKREPRKDVASAKGSRESKELKTRKEVPKEIKERGMEKQKDHYPDKSEERYGSAEKHRERGKRGQVRYEENGDAKVEERERKPKDSRVKNRDRPDQAIYSPRTKKHSSHDYDRKESKESGRSKDRDGAYYSSSRDGPYRGDGSSRDGAHYQSSKGSSSEYSKSGHSGGRGWDYGSDDKPRRGGGRWDDSEGKEKRQEGGRRRDGYRKPKDSYYDHDGEKAHHSSSHSGK